MREVKYGTGYEADSYCPQRRRARRSLWAARPPGGIAGSDMETGNHRMVHWGSPAVADRAIRAPGRRSRNSESPDYRRPQELGSDSLGTQASLKTTQGHEWRQYETAEDPTLPTSSPNCFFRRRSRRRRNGHRSAALPQISSGPQALEEPSRLGKLQCGSGSDESRHLLL